MFGGPSLHDDEADISTLFKDKMGELNARVIVLQRESYSRSSIAYVAYSWVNVFVQNQIQLNDELPEKVPVPFQQLEKEIIPYGNERDEHEVGDIVLFVVYTGSPSWYTEELQQRRKVSDRKHPKDRHLNNRSCHGHSLRVTMIADVWLLIPSLTVKSTAIIYMALPRAVISYRKPEHPADCQN